MKARKARTITITDPSHKSYGRAAVILREGEWYTHVRLLYTDHVEFLEKNQYMANE
jgi:hypothetical protein